MKQRSPTTEEQISGVLTGIWPSETREFSADPMAVLSIGRSDVLKYLAAHPSTALEYLKKWESVRPAADINAIWAEGSGYKVAWTAFDGKSTAVLEFRNLNDAVVEHVSRQNGIKK